MKQRRASGGEKLRARVSIHGKMTRVERLALASWLRRAAHSLARDPEYAEIRNFRLFY